MNTSGLAGCKFALTPGIRRCRAANLNPRKLEELHSIDARDGRRQSTTAGAIRNYKPQSACWVLQLGAPAGADRVADCVADEAAADRADRGCRGWTWFRRT
jgi:hypothetical protein